MCFGKKPSPDAGAPAEVRVTAVVPMDDREITDQYRRLYGEVHTWSHNFLVPPPSLPTLADAQDQLIRAVVLFDHLDPILSNNSLRRSVMEGLVGQQISVMLAGNRMFPVHLEITPVHSELSKH